MHQQSTWIHESASSKRRDKCSTFEADLRASREEEEEEEETEGEGEYSSTSSHTDSLTWISWFCSLPGHECELPLAQRQAVLIFVTDFVCIAVLQLDRR